MIRRLEIAGSILHRPPLLFLDEPTVGLDPIARNAVWEHVEEMRQDYGTTILLTTHMMEEADRLCGRVAIMHLGRVAALGTPAELKASLMAGRPPWTTYSSTTPAVNSIREEITVRLQEQGAQPAGWADFDLSHTLSPLQELSAFLRKTVVIAEFEVRKLRHDPSELVTRAVQPALWLLIFGEVFSRIRAIPTGNVPYLDFMAPGILAQSVLFIAIFYGIAAIWERDLGIVHKLLASPTPRPALVLGKALSAGVRSLPQALFVYVLALLLGVKMNMNPLAWIGMLLAVLLGAAFFATLSLIIACIVKTPGALHGNWPGPDHAAFLRQQRHLSYLDHARLVAGGFIGEPTYLHGRRRARLDAGRVDEQLRSGF